jgi:hypothetical protein
METRMDKRKINTVQAFTILEITIVAAILSVLITIITVALNRFNEQLKVNQEIQKELTNWMLVRSNLWTEYYYADSIHLVENMFVFCQPHRNVYYKIDDEQLMRKEIHLISSIEASSLEEWRGMNVLISSITKDTMKDQQSVVLAFPLKGEDMELRLPAQKNKADLVNTYYEQLAHE